MTCRLFGAEPLSKPALKNKHQWNFNQITQLFIHENASENIVREMVAVLPGGGGGR